MWIIRVLLILEFWFYTRSNSRRMSPLQGIMNIQKTTKLRERSVASSDQNEGFRMELIWSSNLILSAILIIG